MAARADRPAVLLGTKLVLDLVEDVLNGGDVARLNELVAPTYRDHDPVVLPGAARVPRPGWGTLEDLRALVDAVHRPGADLRFTVEDCFGLADRVAYRLFGSGEPGPPGCFLEMQVVGIYRVSRGRLAERWGPATFR